jgi:hypothetical protein
MDELKKLYNNRDFLASYTLDDIAPILGLPVLEDVHEEEAHADAPDEDEDEAGKKRSKKKKQG